MARVVGIVEDLIWRDEPEVKEEILQKLEAGEEIDGLGWVVIVDGGIMHQLNLVAGEIWLLVDGARDEEAIASDLALVFDAEPSDILPDVVEFIDECLAKGWVVLK